MEMNILFSELPELKVDLIVAIISAIVSLACAIITAIITLMKSKKSSYVHIVVEKRLQSVEERRQLLNDLIYYTDPQVIKECNCPLRKKQVIDKLFHIKAGFHYRMVEAFYPEKEILQKLDLLIDKTIAQIETSQLNQTVQTINGQVVNREKCIRLILIYNFASWRYVQNQSSGRRADSISKFEKEYKKTLKDALKCQGALAQIKEERATEANLTQVEKHKQSRKVKNYKELMELTDRYNEGA